MPDPPVSARYLDTSLPLDERVNDLLTQMTLEEKISQMVHDSAAIPRLNMPRYNWWNECLHGVGRSGKATVFPQAIAMAAAFNTELMHRVAAAISDEARAKYHAAIRLGSRRRYAGLTYFTPTINILRDPRWGRSQETYGEDPYLTSRLAVAFVRGLQGGHPKYLKVAGTAKHLAAYSGPEAERHRFNAVVEPRDMMETYLPAFKACVQEAEVASVMGAYNRTNGEPCSASETLLVRVLRDEWGFDGYVVSDCGAIRDIHENHMLTAGEAESAAMGVRNGCDLNCGTAYESLGEAIRGGLVTEEEVDVCLRRLLRVRFRLGMFDPDEQVPFAEIPPAVVNSKEHRLLAREMARESLVLLKNEGRVLPLPKDIRTLAVIGPNATAFRPLLGNYYGYSQRMVTPLEGIVSAVSPGTDIQYAAGCELRGSGDAGFGKAASLAARADAVIAVMGFSPELEGEEGEVADSDGGGDRGLIGLPGNQQELLELLQETGTPLVLVLTCGSPVEIGWAKDNVPAILVCWYPGEQGGNAMADVIFGDYSPGGRLPFTIPKSVSQIPPFEDYRMTGRTYRFMAEEPLYSFGYGMSYTEFEYSNLQADKAEIRPGEGLNVAVGVVNTGRRLGDEVVQLYIADLESSVPVPRHQLAGFRRVRLEPGGRKTVAFTIKPEQFMAYDDEGKPFMEPGGFAICIGGGQPDDPVSGAVRTVINAVGS